MALKIAEIVTQAEREAFQDRRDLTLDGQPAHILSSKSPFAFVVRSDGRGGRVEYSWHAVRSVIENRGGAFRS